MTSTGNKIFYIITGSHKYELEQAYYKPSSFYLHASIPNPDGITILPNQRIRIDTGIKFELPGAYRATISTYSYLAEQYGIIVLDSPCIYKCDEDKSLEVLFCNISNEPRTFINGNIIALITFIEKATVTFAEKAVV